MHIFLFQKHFLEIVTLKQQWVRFFAKSTTAHSTLLEFIYLFNLQASPNLVRFRCPVQKSCVIIYMLPINVLELQTSPPKTPLLMSGIAFQSFSLAFSNLDANSTSELKESRVHFRQGTVLDCYGNKSLIYIYRIVVHPFLYRSYSSTLYFDILNQPLLKKTLLHPLLRDIIASLLFFPKLSNTGDTFLLLGNSSLLVTAIL